MNKRKNRKKAQWRKKESQLDISLWYLSSFNNRLSGFRISSFVVSQYLHWALELHWETYQIWYHLKHQNCFYLAGTFLLLRQTSAHSGHNGHMMGGSASLQPVGNETETGDDNTACQVFFCPLGELLKGHLGNLVLHNYKIWRLGRDRIKFKLKLQSLDTLTSTLTQSLVWIKHQKTASYTLYNILSLGKM